jgi:4-hydroxybenzoate polyprenyltransferase
MPLDRSLPLIFQKLLTTLDMIKFEHTVFALPFAFIGALLARKGLPSAWQAGWIVAAMVGGRAQARNSIQVQVPAGNSREFAFQVRACPA